MAAAIPANSMAVMIPISRKNRITFPVLNFPTCRINRISPREPNCTMMKKPAPHTAQRNFLLEKSRQVGTWPYTNETRISMTPPMAIRNSFHQRVKSERDGMSIYFLINPELFLTVGLTHDPFINAVDQKYESRRCREKNIHNFQSGRETLLRVPPGSFLSCLVEQFSGSVGYDGDVVSVDGSVFFDQFTAFQRQQMFRRGVAGDVMNSFLDLFSGRLIVFGAGVSPCAGKFRNSVKKSFEVISKVFNSAG